MPTKGWLKKFVGVFISATLLVNTVVPISAHSQIDSTNYVSEQHKDTRICVSEKTSSDKLTGIDLNGQKISSRLTGKENAICSDKTPCLRRLNKGQTVQFDNVLANVSVRYKIQGQKLKEDFILQSKDAQNSFALRYNIGNLHAKQINTHDILLLDKNGRAKVLISAPYMTDAAGVRSEAVSLRISGEKDGFLSVNLTANPSWLQDVTRRYPVEVDPLYSFFENINFTDLAVTVGITGVATLAGVVCLPVIGIPGVLALGATIGATANGASEYVQQREAGESVDMTRVGIKALGGAVKGGMAVIPGLSIHRAAGNAVLAAGKVLASAAAAAPAASNVLGPTVVYHAVGAAGKVLVSAAARDTLVAAGSTLAAGAAENFGCAVQSGKTVEEAAKDAVLNGACQAASVPVAVGAVVAGAGAVCCATCHPNPDPCPPKTYTHKPSEDKSSEDKPQTQTQTQQPSEEKKPQTQTQTQQPSEEEKPQTQTQTHQSSKEEKPQTQTQTQQPSKEEKPQTQTQTQQPSEEEKPQTQAQTKRSSEEEPSRRIRQPKMPMDKTETKQPSEEESFRRTRNPEMPLGKTEEPIIPATGSQPPQPAETTQKSESIGQMLEDVRTKSILENKKIRSESHAPKGSAQERYVIDKEVETFNKNTKVVFDKIQQSVKDGKYKLTEMDNYEMKRYELTVREEIRMRERAKRGDEDMQTLLKHESQMTVQQIKADQMMRVEEILKYGRVTGQWQQYVCNISGTRD